MKLKDFTTYLNSVRPGSEHAADVWYSWAKDLEEMDSSYGELPEGEYKTAEVFLDDIANEFQYIRKKYGDEITGHIISLADMSSCVSRGK